MALLARGRPLLAAVPVAVGIFTNPMALVVCAILMVADVLARPGTRRRYLVFFAAAGAVRSAAASRGDRLRGARQLPQRDVTAHALPRLRPRRRGPGRRERRPPSPAVRDPVRHVRLRLRGVVRHAGQSAWQQHRPLLHGLRPCTARSASPLTAAAAVPLRRSGGHPHRALRPPADQRALQPLHQAGGAPPDARHLLRPRAPGRATALRPRLPPARRGAAPPLGVLLLSAGRLSHHARLVPAGRRDPQRALLRTATTRPPTSCGCGRWAWSTSS